MSTYRSLLLAGAMVVGFASAADAAILLRASVSTNGGITFTQIGTANDGGTGTAMLVASGLGITVSIQTALGDPALPYPGFSVTGNASKNGNGARTLLLEFSQTGVPTASGSSTLFSDFSLSSLLNAGGATFSSFADGGNVAFGTGTPLAQQVFSGTGSASFADTFNAPGATYAQTIRMRIDFLPGMGAFAGTAQITSPLPVPEPATLALLGAGLLGLGFAARRRKPA